MANSIIHWELMVADTESAKRFYGAVFDWAFAPAGPEFTMITTDTPPAGGLLKRPPGVATSALNTYFQVVDLDATLRRVVEAGGKVVVPRTEIPGGIGWFAMFLDPENIAVGLMQPGKGM
jgi:uncharacterized protein